MESELYLTSPFITFFTPKRRILYTEQTTFHVFFLLWRTRYLNGQKRRIYVPIKERSWYTVIGPGITAPIKGGQNLCGGSPELVINAANK